MKENNAPLFVLHLGRNESSQNQSMHFLLALGVSWFIEMKILSDHNLAGVSMFADCRQTSSADRPETISQLEEGQMFADIQLNFAVCCLSLPFRYPTRRRSNVSRTVIPQIPLDIDEQDSRKVNCDLFTGKWIQNPSGPAYTNASCPFIDAPQNCMKNGQLDTGYLYWRWKPHGCDVPQFNSQKFLKAMRDKSWAFGDSILRNHGQSLVGLLSKAESPVEIYHDEDYNPEVEVGFSLLIISHSVIWSPFLVKANIFEDDFGVSKSEIQLHLNTVNTKWTKDYHPYDYILISVGQGFLKTAVYWENNKVIGCHYCPRLNLTERGMDYDYRKVLQAVFRFMTKSKLEPLVFYRTWTPDHFEYGEWFACGICKMLPYREGEYNGRVYDCIMYRIELEEFNKVAINGSEDARHMKKLDNYHLSLLRWDGHPGPYRSFHPFDKDKNAKVQNDCLHWCLPGPLIENFRYGF